MSAKDVFEKDERLVAQISIKLWGARYKAIIRTRDGIYQGDSMFQDQALAKAVFRWNEAKRHAPPGMIVA